MEKAKHLKVLVKKDGTPSVDIQMPIYSVKIIDTLIPEPVLSILEQKNINLKKIIEDVKNSDYAPQTLFEEEADVDGVLKSYKVWIEWVKG